jgi:hypothetical protein
MRENFSLAIVEKLISIIICNLAHPILGFSVCVLNPSITAITAI